MDRTLSRLQAHLRLGDAVSGARGSAEVCEAALDYVREHLGVERSAIQTFDEHDVMRFRASRGVSERYRAGAEGQSPWRPDSVGFVPSFVPDVSTEPRLESVRSLLEAEGIASLVFVPLRARGRLIGKLALYGDKTAVYDEEWLRVVTAAADIIAGALDGHRAQEQLRDANALLTTLMDRLPDALGFIDPRGHLVYTSRRIETFFDVSADAVLGMTAREFMEAVRGQIQAPEDVLRRMQEVVQSHQPLVLELRHVDGRVFELSFAPTGGPGALEGHLLQLRDMTQRRELEARLRHAHNMESVGRLAGGVAHDFNNMLTAMIGYMDLVAAGLPPEAEEQLFIKQALEAADQASGLTRQLLAFARRQPVQPTAQDVNALLERVAPLLRRLVPENVEIVTRPEARPGWVLADAGQLEQVLVNLAFNARDAMPDGGRLTLSTGNERGATLDGGEAVVLVVSDTGVGMDAETMARAFEPFYTTKPEGHGSGLGLATVYGIVQQFGGQVEVSSEPGYGSRFRVLLPAAPAPAAAPVPERAPRGSETVLLVEDDASVRGLVTAMLGRLGYVVLAADRADRGLELLARHEGGIDLLIADIVMPGMSGRELATRALAARPHLRVLLTSGQTVGASGAHVAAGFAFMPKPFSIETLARRVRETLAAPAAGPATGAVISDRA